MSAEGVCIPMCGVEEDEEGICEGGTKGGLGATIWVCNLMGGAREDKDGICKPNIGVVGLSGIRST